MSLNIDDISTFNDLEDAINNLDKYREELDKLSPSLRKEEPSDYGDDELLNTIKETESTFSVHDDEKAEIRKELSEQYGKYGVQYIADLILRIAMSFVPVKTGRLQASGRAEVDENSNTARVIFGEGLNYAVYVHEILDYVHLNGRAKFLEDAAYQVVNISQVGSSPLFTFSMSIEGSTVVCEINSIDQDRFMNNLEQRNALFNMSFDELDDVVDVAEELTDEDIFEDLGGETID